MPNNYDAAAWFYDGLAQLVYGKSLINAHLFLLKYIPPQSKILIVGGGTGWILEEISRVHPASLKIVYVEISSKMTALSKKRNCGKNEVTFINLGIEDYPIEENFDLILTPFLFDNFSKERVENVFQQLDKHLKKEGLWLLCDFQVQDNKNSIWQKVLLQTMYWFFGWLCGVETDKLVKMDTYFDEKDYGLKVQQTFYRGFVISQVYQKHS